MITLKTNYGDIQIELDDKKAPITSKNFIEYVEQGFYDGTIFHRVIKNFMIQGGGFTPDMSQKSTNPEIENEAANGLKNSKYSIAMARTMAPHSASSQFFINVVDNPFLDFGKVVDGFDVVDNIGQVQTGNAFGHADVPNDPVIIEKAIMS